MTSVSVVIPTYQRVAPVARLLTQLAKQTVPPGEMEVVVVDDGSTVPVRGSLECLKVPFKLKLVEQPNGGAAKARDAGVKHATGDVIVFVDDDMQIEPEFLEAHLRAHREQERCVVFGYIKPDDNIAQMPLFERYHAEMLDRWVADVKRGTMTIEGQQLCTGNVSMRKNDYLSVGGFDANLKRSEDAELGLRLQQAGCKLVFGEQAATRHSSDHESLEVWLRRAFLYGAYDLKIARKHPDKPNAHPWRFLFLVNPVSRPLLFGAATLPGLFYVLSRAAMGASLAIDKLGFEKAAIAGNTLVYGLEYFRGMRSEAGSLKESMKELQRFVAKKPGALKDMLDAIRADHEIISHYDTKYKGEASTTSLPKDAVKKIGLQMMIAYRLMRFFRAAGQLSLAQVTSRMIRHMYGADIHWDAELAPGVMIVHGVGLVIGHSAKVGPGCILFHHVTLGEGIDPETRVIGTPRLEKNVHVGPGATLLGPITLGDSVKIGAGACVISSVSPFTRVDSAPTVSTSRRSN